jgi:hypothetical protein
MQDIKDIKPGAKIEAKAKIIDIGSIKFYWKCFDCDSKGIIEEEIKVCPNCKAVQTKKRGKGLWVEKFITAKIKDETETALLDLWGKDAEKYSLNDRIHLINCYAKQKDIGLILSKGLYGSILKLEV